jgi:hypothetical protein
MVNSESIANWLKRRAELRQAATPATVHTRAVRISSADIAFIDALRVDAERVEAVVAAADLLLSEPDPLGVAERALSRALNELTTPR